MYARVSMVSAVSPDRAEQGISEFRDKVAPWVREQGGKGAIMLVDRISGNGVAITLWDSEEAMRASENAADELRRGAAEAMGSPAPPQVERYEVAVFEM